MRSFLRFSSRLFFIVILVISFYIIAIILIGVVKDYQPKAIEQLEIEGQNSVKIIPDSIVSFLSWNIGYCGLGAEMDFFYDGGKMVRPAKELLEKYTQSILTFLKKQDSTEIILLQEVDRNSERSMYQDELEMIQNELPGYSSSFGYNYKVRFVALPFTNPLGRVEMGQTIFSKYKPISSERYSYYSAYSWPKRLFMLDRCFLVSRFRLANGKELVVMNTHNSAYDAGGKLREIEMPLIRDLMLGEFMKGNYVVAGGDWNQNPPGFDLEQIDSRYRGEKGVELNGSLFPDGWKIVFDPETPTNRFIDKPLTEGETKATVIDFFILSPNLDKIDIKTYALNFQFSDHNPVSLSVRIK